MSKTFRGAVPVLALFGFLAGGCHGDAGETQPVDFSKPDKVLDAVFWAATTGETSQLRDLCAPDADGDARRICTVTTSGDDWEKFKTYFAKGAINGAPRIAGSNAEIDFRFGPDGSKDETMNLVKIDGKWKLTSF